MDVKMEHGLARAPALIDDEPESPLAPGLAAKPCGEREEFADLVVAAAGDELAQSVDVAGRQHENVRRRLRVDIAYRERLIAARDLLRRNLAADDFAKEARLARAHFVPAGRIRSKSSTLSGRGMTPLIRAFIAKGTLV